MVKVEKSISIKAPVAKVFNYLADPKSNLEIIPAMMDIRDINLTENHVGSKFKWTYKMAGLRFDGETTFIEYVKDKKLVTQGKGGINSKWYFTYESKGEETLLKLVVEYDIPIPVLGKLAEAIIHKQNEREAEVALANIKAITEA